MSDLSVAPAVATGTTAALVTDPIARFHARIDAQLAVAELQRSVARLERRLVPNPRDWRSSQQLARQCVGMTGI